jgi:hypothetical protein
MAELLPAIAFAAAAGVVFAPRSLVYDASLFLPLVSLRFPPRVAILIGAVLLAVLTPAAIAGEIASIAVLWVASRVHS